jgi:hypothetical protein
MINDKNGNASVLGVQTEFFIYLGKDGPLRRPGVVARRPCLCRILSCTQGQRVLELVRVEANPECNGLVLKWRNGGHDELKKLHDQA